MKKQTIETIWELRAYYVWGNSKDGFEVNDSFVVDRDYPLTLTVTVNNKGTAQEFLSAYPTDRQIRKALDLSSIKLDLEGDDLTIYVNRSSNGYPLGELHCVSHESLSPIRIKA
jgi:hypothetical protein